jgi:uncharacterized protein YbjT (DUF2867 family)
MYESFLSLIKHLTNWDTHYAADITGLRRKAGYGGAALRADAAESAVCGYLALIALAGLVLNAIWRVSWADAVAALALLPLIIHEAREAMKGKPCCDVP